MLLSHFLANQIAEKPVRMSCQVNNVLVWIDSTVLWV